MITSAAPPIPELSPSRRTCTLLRTPSVVVRETVVVVVVVVGVVVVVVVVVVVEELDTVIEIEVDRLFP
jgi:hypothetical protein